MPIPRFAAVIAVAVLLANLTGAQVAVAASPEGTYAAKGAGPQNCELFVAEREKQSQAYFRFLGWVEGYVSLFNKLTPDTTDVLSWQTTELIDLLLNNFCKANPQTRFNVAVDTLVGALYPTRLRAASEVIDIEGSDPPLQLYKDVVRRVQQTLTERGFYKGAIDGAYGPGTATAMKAFQASIKIKETGLPDQISLLRLFQ